MNSQVPAKYTYQQNIYDIWRISENGRIWQKYQNTVHNKTGIQSQNQLNK